MSFVGIGMSLGMPVEIPIIICSLADCLGMVNDEILPLPFYAKFLATLDIGAHNKKNKSKVIGSYELSWWTGRKPRDINSIGIMDRSTVQACIDHYK